MTFAATPEPPYYAVVFTSSMTGNDPEGYAKMAESMERLAATMPGYLGIETGRGDVGVTVSYWQDLESIENWKSNIQHQAAQQIGKAKWYQDFVVRVAKVERDYAMSGWEA